MLLVKLFLHMAETITSGWTNSPLKEADSQPFRLIISSGSYPCIFLNIFNQFSLRNERRQSYRWKEHKLKFVTAP